jgi:hypothetical protein
LRSGGYPKKVFGRFLSLRKASLRSRAEREARGLCGRVLQIIRIDAVTSRPLFNSQTLSRSALGAGPNLRVPTSRSTHSRFPIGKKDSVFANGSYDPYRKRGSIREMVSGRKGRVTKRTSPSPSLPLGRKTGKYGDNFCMTRGRGSLGSWVDEDRCEIRN